MPKVSVIIPVYKVENTLKRCVDSVMNQTLTDLEIILVDDGSPDGCPEMCDKLAELDSRIKVVHKENGGLGFARNSGIEVATGDYVAFVDSDDYIESNMYESLYECAKDNSADAVFSGMNFVNNGNVVSCSFEKETRICTGKNEVKHFLMDVIASDISESEDSKYGAYSTRGLYSNSIIKDNNIRFLSEREYVSEDSVFNICFLTKANKAIMIPPAFYYYDYNPASLTSVYRGDRFDKNKELYKLVKGMLLAEYNDPKLIQQYGRTFIAASRVCIIQEGMNGHGIRGIREITSDELLQDVLKKYPWRKFKFKKMIFSFGMRYRLNVFLYLLIRCAYRRNK